MLGGQAHGAGGGRMSPYRESSPPPSQRAVVRCSRCELELLTVEIPDGLSFAAETMFVLTRAASHGGLLDCPGPPRLELVPWWRALLELAVG